MYRDTQQRREYNPLGKKKRKFPVKKNKLVVHKPDLQKGLSYNKISDSDSDGLDYNEFGGKQKEVARSALVTQHNTATLLSYKPKKRNAPRTRKSDVSELAKKLWRSFPPELKEELRRTLKDSDRDGIPDGFS